MMVILKLDLDQWDVLTLLLVAWILWRTRPLNDDNLKVIDGGKRLERAV